MERCEWAYRSRDRGTIRRYHYGSYRSKQVSHSILSRLGDASLLVYIIVASHESIPGRGQARAGSTRITSTQHLRVQPRKMPPPQAPRRATRSNLQPGSPTGSHHKILATKCLPIQPALSCMHLPSNPRRVPNTLLQGQLLQVHFRTDTPRHPSRHRAHARSEDQIHGALSRAFLRLGAQERVRPV